MKRYSSGLTSLTCFIVGVFNAPNKAIAQSAVSVAPQFHYMVNFWDNLDEFQRKNYKMSYQRGFNLDLLMNNKWILNIGFLKYNQNFQNKYNGENAGPRTIEYRNNHFQFKTISGGLSNSVWHSRDFQLFTTFGLFLNRLQKAKYVTLAMDGRRTEKEINMDEPEIEARNKWGILVGLTARKQFGRFYASSQIIFQSTIRNIYAKNELYRNVLNFNTSAGLSISVGVGYFLKRNK